MGGQGFRPKKPSEGRRNVWVYAFEKSDLADLDAAIQQMAAALPDVASLLRRPGVQTMVVSIGVMSDLMATSVDLAPATLRLFEEKLSGVGLEVVFYVTDFGQSAR